MKFHQEQAELALKPARQALDSSRVPYTVHTDVGDKADCIADAARRLHCDRIVISTARKSSLIRWLEDSVTNKVVERTAIPGDVIAGDPLEPGACGCSGRDRNRTHACVDRSRLTSSR